MLRHATRARLQRAAVSAIQSAHLQAPFASSSKVKIAEAAIHAQIARAKVEKKTSKGKIESTLPISTPQTTTIFHRSALQKNELSLTTYSYQHPAGAIESMTNRAAPRLHVLTNEGEINEELSNIRGGSVLSLDMEWYRNGRTSVLQLASPSDVYVLQLGNFKKLPLQLLRIMKDVDIVKCGAAIRDDAKRLVNDFGEEATLKNVVDIGEFARFVDSRLARREQRLGLAFMCQLYLDRRLDKYMARSNWNDEKLSKRQIEYAASDAYVGLELLHHLAGRGADLKGLSPRPCATLPLPVNTTPEVVKGNLSLRLSAAWGAILSQLDRPFSAMKEAMQSPFKTPSVDSQVEVSRQRREESYRSTRDAKIQAKAGHIRRKETKRLQLRKEKRDLERKLRVIAAKEHSLDGTRTTSRYGAAKKTKKMIVPGGDSAKQARSEVKAV
jgi:hypothetical protein